MRSAHQGHSQSSYLHSKSVNTPWEVSSWHKLIWTPNPFLLHPDNNGSLYSWTQLHEKEGRSLTALVKEGKCGHLPEYDKGSWNHPGMMLVKSFQWHNDIWNVDIHPFAFCLLCHSSSPLFFLSLRSIRLQSCCNPASPPYRAEWGCCNQHFRQFFTRNCQRIKKNYINDYKRVTVKCL